MDNHRVEVDTSRPFRSVKEAVALFGERHILAGDLQSRKRNSTSVHGTVTKKPPPENVAGDASVNRLEETKEEVTVLEERGSEMETVVASLGEGIQKSPTKSEDDDGVEVGGRENVWYRTALVHMMGTEEDEKDRRRMATRKKKNKKKKKKKPVVPLVGDVFSSMMKTARKGVFFEHRRRRSSACSPPSSGLLR